MRSLRVAPHLEMKKSASRSFPWGDRLDWLRMESTNLTNQYVYGRVGYLHQIGQLPAFLGRGVYLDGHFEAARIYGSMHPEKIPLDGVAGIVTETLFGPLMIGGSVGGDGHRKWFFQLGKVF